MQLFTFYVNIRKYNNQSVPVTSTKQKLLNTYSLILKIVR